MLQNLFCLILWHLKTPLRPLTAMTVILNDLYLNDLGTHTRDGTNFFPFTAILFLYTSIHCVAALLQIIYSTTQILLGTPYYVCVHWSH